MSELEVQDDAAILGGLAKIRRRKRMSLASFGLYALVLSVVGLTVTKNVVVLGVLFVICVVIQFLLGRRVMSCKCPRCAESFFFTRSMVSHPYRSRCANCGIPLDWQPGVGAGGKDGLREIIITPGRA